MNQQCDRDRGERGQNWCFKRGKTSEGIRLSCGQNIWWEASGTPCIHARNAERGVKSLLGARLTWQSETDNGNSPGSCCGSGCVPNMRRDRPLLAPRTRARFRDAPRLGTDWRTGGLAAALAPLPPLPHRWRLAGDSPSPMDRSSRCNSAGA